MPAHARHAMSESHSLAPPCSDHSADLQGSLRSLGSNVLSLALSHPKDVGSIAATPAKLLSATRQLVPRLASHVSPAALLNNLVREVNESLHPTGSDADSAAGVPLTESALRRHNEMLSARLPE